MTARRRKLGRLPGDLREDQMVARMIRVNQAGEYGAKRIYEGQIAVLGDSEDGPALKQMLEAEQVHLDEFNRRLADGRVRPTILSPLWTVAGFALGAGTALLGRRAAMACTVAVEEVIEEHYTRQADYLSERLGEDGADLLSTVESFRDDEVAHKHEALARDAEKAPAYPLLSGAIKAGSRLAIWLSERI